MSDVEITIKLPEELVERARAIGLPIEDQVDTITEAVEKAIRRGEAAKRLKDMAEQLHALPDELKPTTEDIDAEIKAYRAEKAAQDTPHSHS